MWPIIRDPADDLVFMTMFWMSAALFVFMLGRWVLNAFRLFNEKRGVSASGQ
jgi:hypothetical protein